MIGSVMLLLFFLLLFFFIRVRRPKNVPPGPRPLPILGNLLQLDPVNPLKDLERLKRRYGNVFSLYIGSRPVVVLNGLEAVREALVTRTAEFSGRPNHLMISDITEGKGIGFLIPSLYELIPALRALPLPFKKAFHIYDEIKEHAQKAVTRHKSSRVTGEPRDLIDCYLDQIDKIGDGGSTFNDVQMVFLLIDLFIAGTDTTSNTLRCAILHLMTNQHIQERCHWEIEDVIEGRSYASFEDRHAMPYVQAVIHESQRMADTVPLSVFHMTSCNTQLHGYQLPQGTMVIPNLSSVLHEEGQWKFPQEFNPDNFLNEDGEFVKPEAFLPFSAGSRVCLGEGFARMELFLILVTLLRRFQFVWPEQEGAPDFRQIFGIAQA
ncbi:cytochrome P450 2B5-like [Coregonus clupeaformis]|uniref:cytochrome P450 2B5-like n=1 Tax=Coregonus clupeaformis TaxID=59861 RepID=UPI001BE0AA43|nr:cytochrome P450 2B5-like [Coregonus clupeaformis]